MRCWILVDERVEIAPQGHRVDRRKPPELLDDGACRDELSAPDWRQLADRHAVAGDDERLAAIKRPHHFTAAIAEAPLGEPN